MKTFIGIFLLSLTMMTGCCDDGELSTLKPQNPSTSPNAPIYGGSNDNGGPTVAE